MPNMQTAPTPAQACYWIIGAKNKRQEPAVAIDIHTESGDLWCQTATFSLSFTGFRAYARVRALDYIKQFGLNAAQLNYDGDSTRCFAEC